VHNAIRDMMRRYQCRTREDYVNALRAILQNLALLGLWRSKFFDKAAFYGGSALRVIHGLDRYSEDLDFSLLKPNREFSLGSYGEALCREISSFGFQAEFAPRSRGRDTAIESAFLKTNTYRELVVIEAADELLRGLHPKKQLKIKIEVDTDPPGGFELETEYVLQPVPFPVRVYSLPDLFAGKVHAILCRRWKNRVKGRDWFDLVWYISRYPELRISHLEARMRQTEDYSGSEPLDRGKLIELMREAVENLDVNRAREEVEPFVKDRRSLEVWSRDFFSRIISRVVIVT
jgi:predicted nucleotidyltransferase component of viral defense system